MSLDVFLYSKIISGDEERMDNKANAESKENQLKKVENTGKESKEVTKNEEKTEEKVSKVEKKEIANQIQLPIYGNEINYII
jgi:hypothetical protein